MRKVQYSIRLKPKDRRRLKREVVRLTLNPILFSLSDCLVDWSGRAADTRLHPSTLVAQARERFSEMPLSWAVEGYIALLLQQNASQLAPLQIKPLAKVSRAAKRFAKLSLAEKTRAVERWKHTLRTLRRAV